jgi:hypothetical protein
MKDLACFRIYTENVNYQDTIALVTKKFPNFTVYKGEGYFDGQSERALVIEIICGFGQQEDVLDLAWDIKKQNKQEQVLVTCRSVACEEV